MDVSRKAKVKKSQSKALLFVIAFFGVKKNEEANR